MPRRSKNNGHVALRSLTVFDQSDRELLFVCDRCVDRDGLINAADVAVYLGIASHGNRTPAGTVSTRFSWMRTCDSDCPRDCPRHYGYLERIDPLSVGLLKKDGPRWVITPKGRDLMARDLKKTLVTALSQASSGQATLVLQQIMAAQRDHGDFRAVRRQYNNSYAALMGRR